MARNFHDDGVKPVQRPSRRKTSANQMNGSVPKDWISLKSLSVFQLLDLHQR